MVSGGLVEVSVVLVELSELDSVVGVEAVVVSAGGEVTSELVLEELISVLLEVEALVEALVDDWED